MLHGIDLDLTPDLMDCLMCMGHGDELAIVDANYPATSSANETMWRDVIYLPRFTAPDAISMITKLLPLDGFSGACALRMEIDNAPNEMGDVHTEAFAIIDSVKPAGAVAGHIERQEFYKRASQAFAIVATSENRPFGCFILRKGAIF
jgi:L-fucose mutarotase